MSFPQFGPSGGDQAQIPNEESNRSDNASDDASIFHPHSRPAATFQPARPTTNRNSGTPAAETSGREGSGQHPPHTPLGTSAGAGTLQDHIIPDDVTDLRRASDSSERTLYDQAEEEMQRSLKRVSLSSYQHPNDIVPPGHVYFSGDLPRSAVKRRFGHRQSLDDSGHQSRSDDENDIVPNDVGHQAPRHSGVVSNLLELSRVSNSTPKWDNYLFSPSRSGSLSESDPDMRPRLSRLYSLGWYDADDPRITGATRDLLDDPADLERNVKDQMDLRSMSYKQRRREAQKIKIRFFVTCMSMSRTPRCVAQANRLLYEALLNRQQFIMKLARALMTFGAPSHRIESQLVATARILEVDAEFIHLPNIFLLSFADPETCTSETHFIKCSGRLALGNLKMVHQIYRQVVHDEISAKRASNNLDALLASKPIYPVWARCAIAFCLSALICPLAFGGSLVDMFIAGFGALVLSSLHLTVVVKGQLYANVFE